MPSHLTPNDALLQKNSQILAETLSIIASASAFLGRPNPNSAALERDTSQCFSPTPIRGIVEADVIPKLKGPQPELSTKHAVVTHLYGARQVVLRMQKTPLLNSVNSADTEGQIVNAVKRNLQQLKAAPIPPASILQDFLGQVSRLSEDFTQAIMLHAFSIELLLKLTAPETTAVTKAKALHLLVNLFIGPMITTPDKVKTALTRFNQELSGKIQLKEIIGSKEYLPNPMTNVFYIYVKNLFIQHTAHMQSQRAKAQAETAGLSPRARMKARRTDQTSKKNEHDVSMQLTLLIVALLPTLCGPEQSASQQTQSTGATIHKATYSSYRQVAICDCLSMLSSLS